MASYEEFKAQYIEPTFGDYVKMLLTIPTWGECKLWSDFRMDGGPMTEAEYQAFMTMTDDKEWNRKNADSINRSRCRTTIGWYLYFWIRFFMRPFTYSFAEYKNDQFSDAYDNYLDAGDLRY